MKKLLLISLVIFFTICSKSWALPECEENSFHNCTGKFTEPDTGNIYIGDFKDGQFHGNGMYVWANGEKFIGEIKNGEPFEGIQYYSSGEVWGNYENGKFIEKAQTTNNSQVQSSSKSVNVESLYNNGMQAEQAGRYKEASEWYSKCYSTNKCRNAIERVQKLYRSKNINSTKLKDSTSSNKDEGWINWEMIIFIILFSFIWLGVTRLRSSLNRGTKPEEEIEDVVEETEYDEEVVEELEEAEYDEEVVEESEYDEKEVEEESPFKDTMNKILEDDAARGQFLGLLPKTLYHAFDGTIEVFNKKDLSFECGCGKSHKTKYSFALVDNPPNHAVYVCPDDDNIFNLIKINLLRNGTKTIASYISSSDKGKTDFLLEIEARKKQ